LLAIHPLSLHDALPISFMHPNGRQIIFASNLHDPSGRSFALYLVNVDGSSLERVTWADGFASFPMFTRDGKRLVFCGSRGATSPGRKRTRLNSSHEWIS